MIVEIDDSARSPFLIASRTECLGAKSERCDNEGSAPENRIDCFEQVLTPRYMDESSPLDRQITSVLAETPNYSTVF